MTRCNASTCSSVYRISIICKNLSRVCPAILGRRSINLDASPENHVGLGPLKYYSSMLDRGVLKPDRNQFAAVNQLQMLFNDITSYETKSKTGNFSKIDTLFRREILQSPEKVTAPRL